jgi:malonyl-CoA O-methyltransferase
MNAPPRLPLDARAVRRAFERSSSTYAAAAHLQAETRQELLARLEFFPLQPAVVLDLGAGLGEGAEALRERYPRAQVIEVDVAESMLRTTRRGWRFWRRRQAVCADVRRLPLASGSVDLAISNLMLQWCDVPAQAFAEIGRVLKGGGLLLASSFGPLTLQELRAAWASADDRPHVNDFPDLPQLAGDLMASGFQEPVLDREMLTHHHAQLATLMRELRELGARNATAERRRALTGAQRWRHMQQAYEHLRTPDGLPVTWELVYLSAFAGERRGPPPPGDAPAASEHTVALGSIGRRRRP